jgi:succinate dehydrogenase / fumarate reductase cytochrome b subunit
MTLRPRPLSPHLSVYRFTLTMTMSIVHRITGIGLYTGMAILALWLVLAAIGGTPFALAQGFFGHWLGQLILFGFTWALFQHLLGGVKHFAWDATLLMGRSERFALAGATLIGSIVLTLLTWSAFVWFRW